jgi:hypothetical protein
VFVEVLDSKFEPPLVYDVVYSVRRKNDVPEAPKIGLPRALGGRIKARSAGCKGGGFSIAEIARKPVSQETQWGAQYLLPDSSLSKTPGMPTRSIGMPSSASASMFNGCSRASREANPAEVYCPLDRPVLGMSRSFGGHGGGGSALEYRMRAM